MNNLDIIQTGHAMAVFVAGGAILFAVPVLSFAPKRLAVSTYTSGDKWRYGLLRMAAGNPREATAIALKIHTTTGGLLGAFAYLVLRVTGFIH